MQPVLSWVPRRLESDRAGQPQRGGAATTSITVTIATVVIDLFKLPPLLCEPSRWRYVLMPEVEVVHRLIVKRPPPGSATIFPFSATS